MRVKFAVMEAKIIQNGIDFRIVAWVKSTYSFIWLYEWVHTILIDFLWKNTYHIFMSAFTDINMPTSYGLKFKIYYSLLPLFNHLFSSSGIHHMCVDLCGVLWMTSSTFILSLSILNRWYGPNLDKCFLKLSFSL